MEETNPGSRKSIEEAIDIGDESVRSSAELERAELSGVRVAN